MLMCRFRCNRQYQTLAAMVDQRKASHRGASAVPSGVKKRPVVACNDCNKTFSSIDVLRPQHQLSMPNHIRPENPFRSFGCDKCGKTLRSQDALEQDFTEDHILIELAKGDSTRTALEVQFRENWRKPSPPRRVLSIFKVYNPGWRTLKFQMYRQQLPNDGNVVLRYHGTTLLCDLGSGAKSSKLCSNDGCHLCCILRTGFKTSKAKDGWQRFGKGIYTTATSGKSNDYVKSSSNRSAVLVCRVLAGNVYRTQSNMPTIKSPPEGYNSVSGEVGKALNYDETVVYTSKAILPAYVIVYTI